MVDILCPHCTEEISLDDDASGDFICPYCNGEFEWHSEETADAEILYQSEDVGDNKFLRGTFVALKAAIKGSFLLSGIIMLVVCFAGLNISSSLMEGTGGSSNSLGGMGIVVVMGIAAIGYLLSASVGLLGISVIITGLISLKK
tara:strand:+ start:186 stop:617 length:432 start_codon:yes stop_codon:yes gene_type:complete